jgi:hypothetical protein
MDTGVKKTSWKQRGRSHWQLVRIGSGAGPGLLRHIAAIVVLAGLLLASCSPAPPQTPPNAPTQNNPADTTPAPSSPQPAASLPPAESTPAPLPNTTPPPPAPGAPVPGSLPEGVLAVYTRSGCFTGVNEVLTVHADGALEFTAQRGPSFTAPAAPQDMQTLQKLLSSAEYVRLKPLYQAMGADLCVYNVVSQVDGKVQSVTTMDAAPTPPILQQVIDLLGQMTKPVQ